MEKVFTMTHWNHRIVKYKDGQGFGLHEVYYDDVGNEVGMTKWPVRFAVHTDEGAEGVITALELAMRDARTRPVFEEPEQWPDASQWNTIKPEEQGASMHAPFPGDPASAAAIAQTLRDEDYDQCDSNELANIMLAHWDVRWKRAAE
jgi:hypothetical protein